MSNELSSYNRLKNTFTSIDKISICSFIHLQLIFFCTSAPIRDRKKGEDAKLWKRSQLL